MDGRHQLVRVAAFDVDMISIIGEMATRRDDGPEIGHDVTGIVSGTGVEVQMDPRKAPPKLVDEIIEVCASFTTDSAESGLLSSK